MTQYQNSESPADSQTLIVVLGMHRSGTSAITRALETMGVNLGERLMPPAPGVNDKGFYEDLDLVALNEAMLDACGYNWDSAAPILDSDVERLANQGYVLEAITLLRSRLARYPLFGMKDPRIAKLMPFWRRVFTEAGINVRYVMAYRNPLSVVQSLEARDEFARTKSFLLVADYMVTSLSLVNTAGLVMIDYDRLMADPRKQLEELSAGLGLALDQAALDAYCTDFLEPGLRHSQFAARDLQLDPSAIALVKDIHAALCAVLDGSLALQELVESNQLRAWQQELLRWRAALQLLDTMDSQNGELQRDVKARDTEITTISEMVRERDRWLTELTQQLEDSRHEKDQLSNQVQSLAHDLEQQKADLESFASIVEQQRLALEDYAYIHREMIGSTSWRVTAPIRLVGKYLRTLKRVIRILPDIAQARGGYRESARLAFRILRSEGMVGVRARILRVERDKAAVQTAEVVALAEDKRAFEIVPYYVDPRLDEQTVPAFPATRVAIHLHLFYQDCLAEFISRFALIPGSFDLFISVPEGVDEGDIVRAVKAELPRVGAVVVEAVPNRGRDLAPLIIQFGKRLAEYEVIGHFHTKKSPHNPLLAGWGAELLNHLLGRPGTTGARLAFFFKELATGTKLIYPEGRLELIKDATGWGDNYSKARSILEQYTDLDISDYPEVEFPEGTMFWARAECLKDFLCLPLQYTDFEEEPIGTDGTLAHALERLVSIFAAQYEGRSLRLHLGDSITDYTAYEAQKDFSADVVHKNVKVLAYYLPQFHPTPENDEWHGKGFTEWTKVTAANPLFEGHYQQHIPHEDIGYYLLDTPETLRKQAENMRQAGVFGQVFYHYWFGGRMILEKPARMLLENKDIQMPFCFCWANENWTRRWDGNESEVLLAQNYSPEDARGFIQYLIPFFRDERYIHVGARPVLFVYRSSSIPEPQVYLDVWKQECLAAGLQPPYVVAVLTRGATDPAEFGMDAGTERVLHDWTAGNAPEIKHRLSPYAPINGSVLHYDDVADYCCREQKKDFTYFRNIVPMWDNTARYGSEAYVVHGSSPQRFQQWFEHLLDVTNESLPEDRQFILVNAWNEWAEGAHLEPDNRYGYSYLNSIGRALSGIPYESQLNQGAMLPSELRIHIELPPHLVALLESDAELAGRFIYGLRRALALVQCEITVGEKASELLPEMALGDAVDAQFTIEFRGVAFFPPSTLSKLLQTAFAEAEALVIANAYGGDEPLIDIQSNGGAQHDSLYMAPIVVRPAGVKSVRKVTVRADTHVFVTRPDSVPAEALPDITTVIRIHHKGEFALLHHALGCLAAMRNCLCTPLITAQDFSDEQKVQLERMLEDYQWRTGCAPRVMHFHSAGGAQDLRSKMLNEGLLAIRTRYGAFLDYDDLLMNHAYDWLFQRLQQSGKAVAFGRVFATSYESGTGRFLKRSTVYEYGVGYDEFVAMNHAPLHSFLLDLEQLDLSGLEYYDEHKYMEDYYLTLQLFKQNNADWDSLSVKKYIGDYIYSIDRQHTLAFSSDEERKAILRDPVYQICEKRIQQMRRKINSCHS